MAERSVLIRLKGDISDFTAKMRQAAASAKSELGGELNTLAKKNKADLDAVGGAAGKVGLVAAAGFGAAVLGAANFDQAMSHVAATGDDARASMDALREAAIQAGADTAFSASEAAAGIENLLKAGVSAEDTLGGGLQGALDLAAAGTLEVADAAEIAATAMTQFGLDGEDVPHIADLLAAAAGKAQGEVTDMANSLKYVGPVAAQMGVSIEETTGAIAMLASQGILGDQAGTSLRGMLTALTSPSKQAAKEMQNLGISMYDANGQFIGLEGIAGQLQATMSGLGEAERDVALGRIFGNEQITTARILYAGGADAVADWTQQVNDSGYAAETAATKLDNLRGDVEEFMGSLETALIGSGEGSQGMLRGLVQGATDAVNAFNELPPVFQGLTTGMLGVTAITGGGLWFGSKVITGVVDTRDALKSLGETAPKTAKALQGVAKAGAALGAMAIAGEVLDSWDDAALSATQLDVALNDLSEGRVHESIRDLSVGVDSLGDALKRAAYSDVDFLGTRDEIEDLDRRLASFAATSAVDAAAAFETIQREGTAAGLSVKEIADLFPEYAAQLELTAQEADDAATATDAFGIATANSADEVDEFTTHLETMRDALDGRSDLRDYNAALDEFTEGLKDNGKTLDITTEKGRENQAALDGIATAALDVAEGLDEADRPDFLRQARRDFVGAAEDLGLTRRQARRLATDLGLLEALDPIIDVTMRVTRVSAVRGTGGATYDTRPEVGGGRFADGGYTGDGGKYEAAGVVHRGEYVINAEATRRNYALLERINGGYASGGMVATRPAPAAPAMDVAALAQQFARSAPMIGQQTVLARDMDDWMRQTEETARLEALGGAEFR